MSNSRGFTLVELVVTIAVAGILAVTLVPRFAKKSDFDQVGFHDQVVASLRYARQIAIASRRNVCVTASPAQIEFQVDPQLPEAVVVPSCSRELMIPGRNANTVTAPADVTLTPGGSYNFYFSPEGRPLVSGTSASATYNVAGQLVTVESETGYVQ